MVGAETEVAPTSATGPSPVGAPLRIGMFGGGTVGGGVYEICEQVWGTVWTVMYPFSQVVWVSGYVLGKGVARFMVFPAVAVEIGTQGSEID